MTIRRQTGPSSEKQDCLCDSWFIVYYEYFWLGHSQYYYLLELQRTYFIKALLRFCHIDPMDISRLYKALWKAFWRREA